jgi:multimeric flavodoxin WrbA
MAKKVIIIEGSPRKDGNTSVLVRSFSEGAEEAGAEVELVWTSSLKYAVNGCTSCYGCKNSDKFECVIKDEATPILARIPEKDIIVLATPVYWFASTAQFKVFFDRAYSLMKWDNTTGKIKTPLKGKQLALLATAGGSMNLGLELLDSSYRSLAGLLKLKYESLLVPSTSAKELAKDPEITQKAKALGKRLAAS